MDNSKKPTASRGTSGTEAPLAASRHVTRRVYERDGTDTSESRGLDRAESGSFAAYPYPSTVLPTIVELGSTEAVPHEAGLPGTPGMGLTPLTGMSSELQGTSAGSPESDPGDGVASGEELHDSADDRLDPVWAVNGITNGTIIAALNERVYRHLNAALALDEENHLNNEEYVQMAKNLALLEAWRYTRKKAQWGTSQVSITSS